MCKSLMLLDNELDTDDNKDDDDDHDDDIMITYVDWGRAESAEQTAKTKCHACATRVFVHMRASASFMLSENDPDNDDNKDDDGNHDDDNHDVIMITYVDWGHRESGELGAKR